MTELEREELEAYRAQAVNGPTAAYYLLAEELGVKPGGSVVDTVTNIVRERDNLAMLLRTSIYRMRRDAKDSEASRKHVDNCKDYLKRHGLQGSPLR